MDNTTNRTTTHWRRGLGALVLLGTLSGAEQASAANWIVLQGTEPQDFPALKPFGFIGLDYQAAAGTDLPAGPWQGQSMVLNQVPPKFDGSQVAQVSYARVGLRGRLLDGELNYWVSPLAGDNAISDTGTPNVKFTDVSATVNLIPHARIRIGEFKFPGSEEGLQPVVLRGYNNPTSVGAQIVNEHAKGSSLDPCR